MSPVLFTVLADIIARCERSGVRLFLENGTGRNKLQARGKGDPPAHLLRRVGEFREALIEALPTLALDRERADTAVAAAIASVPPDAPLDHWQKAIDGLWVFVAAGHAAAAEAAGWTRDELYRVPPTWSRVDLCGVGLLIGDCEVTEVTSTRIQIRTASSALQSFYRKPEFDIALAYSSRVRSLGDDGLKEEPRLRAVEGVVLSYQAHRRCDFESAKAAVLQAIAQLKEKP